MVPFGDICNRTSGWVGELGMWSVIGRLREEFRNICPQEGPRSGEAVVRIVHRLRDSAYSPYLDVLPVTDICRVGLGISLYRGNHDRRTESLASNRTEIMPIVKREEDVVPQVDDSAGPRVNEDVCGGGCLPRILSQKMAPGDLDVPIDKRVLPLVLGTGEIFGGQWIRCTRIWAIFIVESHVAFKEVLHGGWPVPLIVVESQLGSIFLR
jgi:hypothetical protein